MVVSGVHNWAFAINVAVKKRAKNNFFMEIEWSQR